MKRTTGWLLGLTLAVSAGLAGCGGADGAAGDAQASPAPARAGGETAAAADKASPKAPENPSLTSARLALVRSEAALGVSLTDGSTPEWVVELQVRNEGDKDLDGLRFSVDLGTGSRPQDVFLRHGGEIYFTPAVKPGEVASWTARSKVKDGQPKSGDGLVTQLQVGERVSRRPADEPEWKPLDPKNLPPARPVTLDGDGRVKDSGKDSSQAG